MKRFGTTRMFVIVSLVSVLAKMFLGAVMGTVGTNPESPAGTLVQPERWPPYSSPAFVPVIGTSIA